MSPSQRASGSRRQKAAAATGMLTSSESPAPTSATRVPPVLPRCALRRETAAGRPEATGAMSRDWALCVSSTRPIACAPSSRESQTRRLKPMMRTTKWEPLKNAVWRTSL